MRSSLGIGGRWAAATFALCLAGSALALAPKEPKASRTDLDAREFYRPDLRLSTSHVPFEAVENQLANRAAWTRFLAEHGATTGTDGTGTNAPAGLRAWFDPRSGTPVNILGAIPLLPGRGAGNDVTLERVAGLLGRPVAEVALTPDVVGELLRRFVVRNADVFAIDPDQLGAVTAERVSDELWNVNVRQELGGIPVRWGRISATINNGNLVTIGTETWGDARVSTTPSIDIETALKAGFGHAGGEGPDDRLLGPPRLEVVPFAPAALQDGDAYRGPLGAGYGHRLAWVFSFRRAGVVGTWLVSVDAHTGEVLELKDTNHYAKKKVQGGVYPLTNTGICPDLQRCGTMQPGAPMPWADTGLPAPNDMTNGAGVYEYTSGTLRTALSGRYVRVSDTCGAISESSATGDLDLGGTTGQHDCASAGASAGDTPSSRSAFYELNKLIEVARGWLPSNAWLQQQLPTNVNLDATCNAYYDYSSVNFYKSGGGCRNTGEIAAVFDHEWGHGMDDNDSGGSMSVTSESYADIASIYRLQASCVGYGFWWTNDKGCGMTADGTGYNANLARTGPAVCELDCSGVRGADWGRIAGNTPHTPQNFNCVSCDSGSGPCGRQVHCDARSATEAAWDFAARDLQAGPFNYDRATAFMIANKVFYQGSGNIGNWHSCSCPGTSDGCGSTNAYMQWLAADDDNGNLNDGTPHMTALHAAFDRHAIACATPAPANGGCAGGPTGTPALTAAAGSNQVVLTWTAVPGASRYWVLRSEGYAGCDFSKARIATVTGTSYTDAEVANGLTYAYNVVAVGASEACFGRASACVTATPQPCAGSVALDRTVYACADAATLTLVDSDLAGAGSHAVAVFSTTEAAPETLVLAETPAGSGQFRGTVTTLPGPAVAGDGKVSVAHGDTLTARYVDASYCGEPDVPVLATAPVDCAPPVIGGVFADGVTGSRAVIHWTTDEPSDSVVRFGLAAPPSSSAADPTPVTAHAVPLTGLAECSRHVYAVESRDPAGNLGASDNGGAYFAFETGRNVEPAYGATDTPVPIPDNNPAGASSTIAVTDPNTVLDVNVTVNLTHTYDGDITLTLYGPGGRQATLSARRGGSGNDFTGTLFDDAAATPIASGSPPFTGAFRPDSPLSVFNGAPAAGNWTLAVVDSASNDAGEILGWTLHFSYPPGPCGAGAAYASSTATDACLGGGAHGGDGILDRGEDVVTAVTIRNSGTVPLTGVTATLSTTMAGVTVTRAEAAFADMAPDAVAQSAAPHFAYAIGPTVPCGADIPFTLTVRAAEGTFTDAFTARTGSPAVSTRSYPSMDVPKSIPDNNPAGVTSTVAVAETGAVSGVRVTVNLTHSYDGDISLSLVGPNGAEVSLSAKHGSSGDNYTGTVFDDAAATPIASGSPPFTGSFRPDAPLSAFHGLPANGAWTFKVVDSVSNDVGTIDAWTLELTLATGVTCHDCVLAVPSAEPAGQAWVGATGQRWEPVAGASFYNLYRGAAAGLPALATPAPDSCLRLSTTETATGPVLGEGPEPGDAFWYLVRAANAAGEGPAGDASTGPRQQESTGVCP